MDQDNALEIGLLKRDLKNLIALVERMRRMLYDQERVIERLRQDVEDLQRCSN
jgi:hypothetical protein